MQQGMDWTGEMTQLAEAVLWQDLLRSGVREEISDTPYAWFASAQPAQERAMPVEAAKDFQEKTNVPAEGLALERSAPVKAVATLEPAPKAAAAARPAGVVWHAGASGGVVVVVRAHPEREGDIPLQGAALSLLESLLQRAGLGGMPVGYAVLGEAGETIQPTRREALQAAVMALAPQRLLVMGQSAVGTLVGQGIGVEGWQAAPRPVVDGFNGPVGVTYPPELLLQRPLFKRLTWQHLQRWMEM